MRIAIFSDIHGNQYAFKDFIESVNNENIDELVFLGDVFGYYYGQNECLDIMRNMSDLSCIIGNHDMNYFDWEQGKADIDRLISRYGHSYDRLSNITEVNAKFIHSWNTYIDKEIDGIRIGFFHGSPENKINGRIYPDTEIDDSEAYLPYDYIFLGHTHHKMFRKINDINIYNPGSIGQQRDGKGCSYIIFDTKTRNVEWKIVSYDIKPLIEEIQHNDSKNTSLVEVLTRKPRI